MAIYISHGNHNSRLSNLIVLGAALEQSDFDMDPNVNLHTNDPNGWTRQESEAFGFFKGRTAAKMAEMLNIQSDQDIWSSYLPQIALHEPAVKHALCALGSLHQARLLGPGNLSQSALTFAYQQHGRAITHAMSIIHAGPDLNNTSLVICVLFTIFEQFLGNSRAAMTHLQAGLELLKHIETNRQPEVSSPVAQLQSPVHLLSAFGFLLRTLERRLHNGNNSNPTSDADQALLMMSLVPPQFTDLNDASRALERYIPTMLCDVFMPKWVSTEGGLRRQPPPPVWVLHGQATYKQWATAFESLLRTLGPEAAAINGSNQSAILHLRIWQIMFRITLRYDRSRGEMGFDSFRNDFEMVVRYSAVVLRARQRNAGREHSGVRDQQLSLEQTMLQQTADGIMPRRDSDNTVQSFGVSHNLRLEPQTENDVTTRKQVETQPYHRSHNLQPSTPIFDLAIPSLIGALYSTVSKCRDPAIRRSATRLLSLYRNQDDMLVSRLAASIGERLIKIEEYGAMTGPAGLINTNRIERADQIPLESRCDLIRLVTQDHSTVVVNFMNTARHLESSEEANSSGDGVKLCHDIGVVRETWALNHQ